MRRFPVVSVLVAFLTAVFLSLLSGCGGGSNKSSTLVATIVIAPTTLSLNEGGVGTLSAVALNSLGTTVAADITFSSSNPNIATISSGGLICGGVWDANIINCKPTFGQAGVGQVTITATSGTATATMTVYVHLQVDRVIVNPLSGCVSTGQTIPATTSVYSTSAPGCSQNAPCDITNTVGPITLSSNDPTIAAESSGINPTYSSATNSPTYSSGGSITGSKGQTCNLSNFGVGGTSGIDPTYSPATNSPTYTSGGTISGLAGQTCSLSNFNGVNGATATVLLTGTNTIASGAHLIITAEGSGASSPPTAATLGNGTATCSGTANVITALISVAGNGFGVIGATANVVLTGKDTIAAGTHLNVTASGFGATTPATTATLSNGSAMCSGTANVVTALTGSGVFTAQNPGSTSIFASVSGVNGVSTPYVTCPVVNIFVHDASSSNTSFSLAAAGTQPLTADVYDSMGQYIKPNLIWGSSATAIAKVVPATTGNNPATVTAVAPGTASITATCSSPDCNRNLPAQYSTNVVTVAVTGSTTTSVYAASTNSTTLVPISTSTNTAGTAITLPNPPNSMLFDPSGNILYLGSNSGFMAVNLTTNAVSSSTAAGSVVAISPDSNYLLLSNTATNAVYYVNIGNQTLTNTVAAFTTNSAAYTPDSKYNEWVSGMDLSFGFQTFLVGMTNLSYTANAMAISAQGGLTYVTGSNPNQIDVRSTCNQAEVPPTLSANNPTLIQAIPNGTGAVATDSPSVDVISTQSPVTTNCPITTQSTVSSFDLGAGPFKAAQLFLSLDSSRAWIISDLTELLEFNLQSSTPSKIPFAANAVGYSGGITPDGAQVYVGTSDGTVHRIDVASGSDAQQIGVGLKDANGNLVAPNLVGVRP